MFTYFMWMGIFATGYFITAWPVLMFIILLVSFLIAYREKKNIENRNIEQDIISPSKSILHYLPLKLIIGGFVLSLLIFIIFYNIMIFNPWCDQKYSGDAGNNFIVNNCLPQKNEFPDHFIDDIFVSANIISTNNISFRSKPPYEILINAYASSEKWLTIYIDSINIYSSFDKKAKSIIDTKQVMKTNEIKRNIWNSETQSYEPAPKTGLIQGWYKPSVVFSFNPKENEDITLRFLIIAENHANETILKWFEFKYKPKVKKGLFIFPSV